MNCSNCAPIQPIEDQGLVRLKPLNLQLTAAIQAKGLNMEMSTEFVTISYHSKEEMLHLLQWIHNLPSGNFEELMISVTGIGKNSEHSPWLTLSQIEATLEHHVVVDIIRKEQFSNHMQPIVDREERIVGFEFLLRPAVGGVAFQPSNLFEVAHETGLHSFLDRAARISAIETSAKWLPRGYKRFINFLPSSIYNPEYCLTHTFETINRLNLDPKDFVFEVVETEKIDNLPHLLEIFNVYRRNGMKVALDDVGAGYSTLELMNTLEPDYVKIDRSIIDHCGKDPVKQYEILRIIEGASHFNGLVLAEGIERYEDFEFCREAGVEFAQGYFFGKPADRPPHGIQIS
ncbi:EAL domain-containing protein (putative c-di-GMP-specific phosphodiesterase class I) [Paenibacillus sp. DS2015]|uniref:EAL domain-containing protein n=1 Tax=Paenibacillus sp. DS2015 TaxID=3373917 RepID=UPI003D1F2058